MMPQQDEIRTTAEVHEEAALPEAHVVHAVPGHPPTLEEEPLPESLSQQPHATKSPAQWAYERLILYIRNFEQQLDSDHEIAMGFAGTEAGVLRIEGVGYFDPDMVTFYGTDDDGLRTQLIQHVTQLSVFLQAVPKAFAEEPPRRIGFRLAAGLDHPTPAAPAADPAAVPVSSPVTAPGESDIPAPKPNRGA